MESVVFDKATQTFTILNGTTGTYPYADVKKCSVKFEAASFKGKSKPFAHCVIVGVTTAGMMFEPTVYVGLDITMKDGGKLAAYVSEKKTVLSSDVFRKDRSDAEKIKAYMDRIIHKYQNE